MKGEKFMRKINKFFSFLIVITIVISALSCSAFAANPSVEELQKSVVAIESVFTVQAVNYPNITAVITSYGTGFAVGEAGKPVQYIATCNHCVSKPSGVYKFVLDKKSLEIIDYELMPEGTECPVDFVQGNNIIAYDYVNITLTEAKAIFSMSSSEYTTISVIDYDESSDVALCKLASEPTTKIEARPLKVNKDVKVGDSVYAIGYPSTSDAFNDEFKYDYKDSTVTQGIISKSQLTYGNITKERQFYAYQIDADITHGNSGGPLFAEDGSIIGVNAFGYTSILDVAKANYAVSIDELIKILERSKVEYTPWGDTNIGAIIGIVAGVVVIAVIIIILIFILKNKKKGQGPVVNNVPTPAMDSTAAFGNQAVSAPASSGGKYYLLGIKGVYEGKKYSIDERVVIGRNKEKCNVVYPDNQPGISGIHCEIIRSGSVLTLKDCGSSYGTFLGNGTKVTPNLPVVLKSGERFWVGDKENVFEVKY